MSTLAADQVPGRRRGAEGSETRQQLIDVAERMIVEEGCDAVTARRLSEQLGLKRQIIHYYFHSIEDLIIAVIRRQGDRLRDRIGASLENGETPESLWRPGSDSPATVFEFMARATRRKPIRDEVSRYLTEFRQMRADALARQMHSQGLRPAVPPIVVATILTAVGQALALEEGIEVTMGHDETRRYIESWLSEIEQGGAGLPKAI
jgi:AcrR family transcriptional regulator